MRFRHLLLIIGCCCLLEKEPSAAINQVNGIVIPLIQGTPCPGTVSGCIQTGLNFGEGYNPPTSVPVLPGPIDAVLDANISPETFLIPLDGTTFRTVTFRLVQEGAGFENIFGWYNVGSPQERYPVIFSCPAATNQPYEPPTYNSNGLLQGGYVATVNFQAEFAQGRYQGNQIGFYLVTPDDTSCSGANCCATDPYDMGTLASGGLPIDDDGDGDITDTSDFARVYYTEMNLNNDGNYVHNLVYQGVANPEHFYFGFEDLFRGNDNDFEDTLVKVEGLIPTCQPDTEICNGVDDNCNGAIDENVFLDCSNLCGEGVQACQFSNDNNPSNDWGPCNAPTQGSELCNGLDEDCDGIPDNNLPPGGACQVNSCVGEKICQAGVWVCDAPTPTTEICDGRDNDCNGLTDDGLNRQCVTACGTGVEGCQFSDDNDLDNDWGSCTAPEPKDELCNGLDDDCDGTADNNLPPSGPCVDQGCPGELECVGVGGWVCVAPPPSQEICDGKDNNCNGQVDENISRPCFNDCGVGIEQCQFTNDAILDNDWIGCTAPEPKTEICNGQDDDCSGVIDDHLPVGPACTKGNCTGEMVCLTGQIVCNASDPKIEICDGKDNDCDGLTDEDLIRSCFSGCGFGIEHCSFTSDGDPENDWVDCTAPTPGPELCDGVDNDCNGVVDNDVPGEGEPCDDPAGMTCEQGKTKCVGGEIICVGATLGAAEICDCKDNNCNGLIDEGNPCPQGSSCVECGCRIPCTGLEFGCPQGYLCKNDFCMPDKCANVSCEGDLKCVDGLCLDLCLNIQCEGNATCKQGLCVENNCYGTGCPAGQLCFEGRCQVDLCDGVSCSPGEFCNRGICKPSCGQAICGANARCRDGICQADPCTGISCASGIRCVEGACDTECAGISCGLNRICSRGQCIDDPCSGVRCLSANEHCHEGQCISALTSIGTRYEMLATGGGGLTCTLGKGADPGALTWLGLLLGVLILTHRGRRGRDE